MTDKKLTLRDLRERKALTLRQVPDINRTTICELEQGKRKPKASTRRKLARAYGVDPETIWLATQETYFQTHPEEKEHA